MHFKKKKKKKKFEWTLAFGLFTKSEGPLDASLIDGKKALKKEKEGR